MWQGFASRNLHIISSHLIPTFPPPPPIPLLDAPKAFAELPDEIILPNVSAELFAIESQSPVFSSPISSYQSSSIIVKMMKRGMRLGNWLGDTIIISPSQLPISCASFHHPSDYHSWISRPSASIISLLIMKVAKITPAFPLPHSVGEIFKSLRTNRTYHLVPSRLPSQRILFRSLISLVFLLVLWIGPVRTHMASYDSC
jgi:hypothetical protein